MRIGTKYALLIGKGGGDMKTLISLTVAVVMLGTVGSGIGYAHGHGHHRHDSWSGDAGWALAGGLVGGMILGSAMTASQQPTYYYPQPVYYAQPVYTPTPYVYPTSTSYSTTTYTTYPSTTYVVDQY